MSRLYCMDVIIENAQEPREKTIKNTARKLWGFQEWDRNGTRWVSSKENSLCDGENEKDFVDRLAAAIWDANGGYCHVTVNAICLEDQPCKSHVRGATAYERYAHEKYFKGRRKRKGCV
jgi:hypothetical protein